MTATRIHVPVAARMWFGLLGAPFTFTLWLVFSQGLSTAACSTAGSRWDIPVSDWATIATAVAAAICLAGCLTAIALFLATRDAGEAPPPGRVHFLATIGTVTSPLFLCIVLLGGVGTLQLPTCQGG